MKTNNKPKKKNSHHRIFKFVSFMHALNKNNARQTKILMQIRQAYTDKSTHALPTKYQNNIWINGFSIKIRHRFFFLIFMHFFFLSNNNFQRQKWKHGQVGKNETASNNTKFKDKQMTNACVFLNEMIFFFVCSFPFNRLICCLWIIIIGSSKNKVQCKHCTKTNLIESDRFYFYFNLFIKRMTWTLLHLYAIKCLRLSFGEKFELII